MWKIFPLLRAYLVLQRCMQYALYCAHTSFCNVVCNMLNYNINSRITLNPAVSSSHKCTPLTSLDSNFALAISYLYNKLSIIFSKFMFIYNILNFTFFNFLIFGNISFRVKQIGIVKEKQM